MAQHLSPVHCDFKELVRWMVKTVQVSLLAVTLALGLWLAVSERELRGLRSRCYPLTAEHCSRWLGLKDPQVIHEQPSGGNKTYQFWELRCAGQTVFRFWGTHSLIRGPHVEVGPGYLLTYQPEVFPSDTPMGEVCGGWIQWVWDGKAFTPRRLALPRFNQWLRNPVPVQD